MKVRNNSQIIVNEARKLGLDAQKAKALVRGLEWERDELEKNTLLAEARGLLACERVHAAPDSDEWEEARTQVKLARLRAHRLLDQATARFRRNPSAENYHIHEQAALAFQHTHGNI